jgi:hypothetical protein
MTILSLTFVALTLLTAIAAGSASATRDKGLIKFSIALFIAWMAVSWAMINEIVSCL